MIVCVTGHRPNKLRLDDFGFRMVLQGRLRSTLEELRPELAYTGMALGVDQEFAEVCYRNGVSFAAAIPFEGQDERWPAQDRARYAGLLKKAARVEVVSDRPVSSQDASVKLKRRNEYMVHKIGRDGVVIAVWDGSPGGTAHCHGVAEALGRRIIRIDPRTLLG